MLMLGMHRTDIWYFEGKGEERGCRDVPILEQTHYPHYVSYLATVGVKLKAEFGHHFLRNLSSINTSAHITYSHHLSIPLSSHHL